MANSILLVNKGVNNIAADVENAVIQTDKATLALAKKEITFDAVPPGPKKDSSFFSVVPTSIPGGMLPLVPGVTP